MTVPLGRFGSEKTTVWVGTRWQLVTDLGHRLTIRDRAELTLSPIARTKPAWSGTTPANTRFTSGALRGGVLFGGFAGWMLRLIAWDCRISACHAHEVKSRRKARHRPNGEPHVRTTCHVHPSRRHQAIGLVDVRPRSGGGERAHIFLPLRLGRPTCAALIEPPQDRYGAGCGDRSAKLERRSANNDETFSFCTLRKTDQSPCARSRAGSSVADVYPSEQMISHDRCTLAVWI
jgi:hypothetical protein